MTMVCDILLDDSRWTERLDVDATVNVAVAKALTVTKPKLHPEAEVSFTFSDDARIRALNAQWRGKDSPTNVLSFPATVGEELTSTPLLGDVLLAFETVEREAAEERKLFAHHTTHLIVHGFLHLLGFDHETDDDADVMENYESRILTELGLPDPWVTTSGGGKP